MCGSSDSGVVRSTDSAACVCCLLPGPPGATSPSSGFLSTNGDKNDFLLPRGLWGFRGKFRKRLWTVQWKSLLSGAQQTYLSCVMSLLHTRVYTHSHRSTTFTLLHTQSFNHARKREKRKKNKSWRTFLLWNYSIFMERIRKAKRTVVSPGQSPPL